MALTLTTDERTELERRASSRTIRAEDLAGALKDGAALSGGRQPARRGCRTRVLTRDRDYRQYAFRLHGPQQRSDCRSALGIPREEELGLRRQLRGSGDRRSDDPLRACQCAEPSSAQARLRTQRFRRPMHITFISRPFCPNAAVRHREIRWTRRRGRLGFPQVGGPPKCVRAPGGWKGGIGTHAAYVSQIFNKLEA